MIRSCEVNYLSSNLICQLDCLNNRFYFCIMRACSITRFSESNP